MQQRKRASVEGMKVAKIQCPACGMTVNVTASGRLSKHRPTSKPAHWTDDMFRWSVCAGRAVRVSVIRCRKKHHADDAKPCGKVLKISIAEMELEGLGTYLLPSLRPTGGA